MNPQNISFAGAGRVAAALCREMYSKGYGIELIVSQTEASGRLLADRCNADWSDELTFPDSTEIIIVAVPDHSLKSILLNLKCKSGTLVAHTAGSLGIDIFPDHIKKRGVFYPLQTFSQEREVNFRDLPLLIEASDEHSLSIMEALGNSIGCQVLLIDAEHRRMIHLAAVFVSNFTNHMLTVGKELASKAGVPFELLVPLINETISKSVAVGPERSQTGPAIRNDQNTIEKHLELLSFSPELQKIYGDLTRSIIKYHKKS
jgi:predicted short-subunit dehydrogenase-like oxidoreductase (DUF2520 family)